MSAPPRWIEGDRVWAITRYRDAVALLKSDDVAIVEVADNLQKISDRLGRNAFPNLIVLLGTSHPFQNGAAHRDAHSSIRSVIGSVQRRWPAERIGALVDDFLAPAIAGECFDAVTLLSGPLPATIMADMLETDVETLQRSTAASRRISSIWHREGVALRDLYALESVAADLVALFDTAFSGDRKAEYAQIAFLSLAGVSTTKGLLESALFILANDLALQQTLQRAPSMIPAFLNEVLRTRPPLRRIIGRKTTREVELGGIVLSKSALLTIDLERAQRDTDAFPDPDRFDIRRTGPPTLAFGVGAHACLGAALARVTARVAIERILGNAIIHCAGDAQPAADPDWNEYKSLPLKLGALR
ncbi:MAG: cytochrome P450 [Alphaproteobacteria bacterium]|nr:cytochrome P450 [Alphaproteobacteria bacterium]